MSASLLPPSFWFRLALPCPRVEGVPRPKGRLLDLPDACVLPSTVEVEGGRPWAEVRAGWNPGGLALAFEVSQAGPGAADPDGASPTGVEAWVDTRDTRTVHRATRFCHRFTIRLTSGDGSTAAPRVTVAQRTIARALADAPLARPEQIQARAERLRRGWRLELFLPAEVLHGFDPETNRRLGFAYQVNEPDREAQSLGAGAGFPLGEDPSLWSTLELLD